MAYKIQFRRGTSAEHSTFTGAPGEVTVDTTDNRLVVHDGSTAGGIPMAKESEITASGISDVVDDTTPQAGGDLDMNGNNIQFDNATGIEDDSGNEQLLFSKTASAVNYLNLTNAATGSGPSIAPAGSDTNVDLTIDTKGTGTLALGSADSVLTLDGTSISGTLIKDEDDLTSDSATHLATQQSIKAYVDAQSSGGLVLVGSATASNDATIDFTGLSSTYQAYLLVASNVVPATDSVNTYIRLGTGAGPTYLTGASSYSWAYGYAGHDSTDGGVGDNTSDIIRLSATAGNATGEAFSFSLWLYDPSDTSTYKGVSGTSVRLNQNAQLYTTHFGGVARTTSAVTAIRFFFSSGNVSTGEFRLYGVKNA